MTMTSEYVSHMTFLLFLFLVLALFVERLLEVCVSIFNYFDLRYRGYLLWNRLARRIQLQYSSQVASSPAKQRIIGWLFWKIMVSPDPDGSRSVISAALVRVYSIRAATRILGVLVSLALILFIHYSLEIDLLIITEQIVGTDLFTEALSRSTFLKIVLSAIAIAIGVEPLHLLISRIGKPQGHSYTIKK